MLAGAGIGDDALLAHAAGRQTPGREHVLICCVAGLILRPSIVTGSEIVGNAVEGVIVWSPEPGMLKTIVSAPGWALASRIACLSEPAPLSPALVTTNTDAGAVSATASGLESASETTGARMKPNTNGADSSRAALLVVLLIGNRMEADTNMKAAEAREKRFKVTRLATSSGTRAHVVVTRLKRLLPFKPCFVLRRGFAGRTPKVTAALPFRHRARRPIDCHLTI